MPDLTPERRIQYTGQLAGITVAGLLETFDSRSEPLTDLRAWLGTLLWEDGDA